MLDAIKFLDASVGTAGALPSAYEPSLVILSYFVASLASYATLNLAHRSRSSERRAVNISWSVAGALAMGCGVWGMHFIGMLSFSLPVPVRYNVLITILSVIPAVLAGSVALQVAGRKSISTRRLLTSGTLMGVGIGTMHFAGMSAMRMPAMARYDAALFVGSILVAVILATLALYTARVARRDGGRVNRLRKPASALIMGLSVTGMHYTAMAGVYFFPTPGPESSLPALDPMFLGTAIGVIVVAILILTIVAVVIDTRLASTTSTMHQTREQLLTILETMVEGVITIDEQGVIESFNASAEAMFGYSAGDVVGENVRVLMSDEYGREHDSFIARYIETGAAKVLGVGREVAGKHKNGSTFPMRLGLGETKFNGERKFVGTVYDITAHKAAQSALQESERQALLAMQNAEQASRAKTEFLSSMSHELRTPMNAVLGFAQLLEQDGSQQLGEINREFVDEILRSGHHMLGLIEDVLDLAKIESGDVSLEMGNHAPRPLIDACLEMVSASAGQDGITVRGKFPAGDVPTMRVDPLRFKQSLLNLLWNGIKYNSPGGEVVLETTSGANGILHISVSDNGKGIPEDKRDQVFEPFERLDVQMSDIPGTGIGLAITKKMIESMGGTVGFESTVGEGTTFWINLPVDSVEGSVK